jgi:nickel-dependent lactate racemase
MIKRLKTFYAIEDAMTFSLPMACGDRTVALTFDASAEVLTIREPESVIDARRFQQRITRFLAAQPPDLSNPAVVVADKTRLCDYPHYLPVLLDQLIEAGAPSRTIRLYIAYGTHPRQSDAQSRRAYGPVFDRYNWVHHRCDDMELFDHRGETRRGTPVWIRKDIAQASSVITFGAVSHHYFAGFGGGRKLLFPGLGAKAAIYANHGLFLDRRQRVLAAGCRPGCLTGNPLAEDLAEVEAHLPADMAVHGILNSRGRVCDLVVGQGPGCFQAACDQHARACQSTSRGQYDLVVASCGGYPKDVNFIQSHKAVHHAAAIVRDGGELVVLAQCRDGIGSETFLPWFEYGGWDGAFDRLCERYVGNGGTALALMAKTRRLTIQLVTDLDPDTAGRIGVQTLSADQLQRTLDRHQGSIAVIPNASMLVRGPDVVKV